MEIPDHLTCLLRNLHAGQEATIKTGCGTMDRFKIGKGVRQGCILPPCLLNLYAELLLSLFSCSFMFDSTTPRTAARQASLSITNFQSLQECMQSTSCEMPGWMKKLESRLPGEISITSDMQMTSSPLWQKARELKSLLMKVKEVSEKAGLKFNIQKSKIMASGPFTSRQIDGETIVTPKGHTVSTFQYAV